MFVRILGPVSVEVDGRVRPIAKPKERAVLAVLALRPGRVVATDTLVDALWGDEPPRTASKSLHAHVSRVRSQIGADSIQTETGGYRLAVPPDCVDAGALEAAIRAGDEAIATGHPEDGAAMLINAVASWRGDPLTELADGPFAVGEQTRLAELHLTAVERLADALIAANRAGDAIADLEALVEQHPLREPLWARLMLALYRSGRQSDALRSFQRARRALIEEMGIEPGVELRELERRIIGHDPSLSEQPAFVDSRAFVSDLHWTMADQAFPFMARVDARQRLEQAWRDTCRGDGTVTFAVVSGEAGIGKTRLVAEFAGSVAAEALVLFGRCDEDLAAAYQPFIEALRWFIAGAPPGSLDAMLGPLAPELSRVLPELSTRVPDLAEPLGVEPGTSRLRLFDAIRDFLHAIALMKPTLLVLDDLQWTTSDTIQLLRRVVTDHRPAPLLVVGTFRDTDVDGDHLLPRMIADLWRSGRRHTIALAAFGRDDVRDLLMAVTGEELPTTADPLVDALLEETGGNTLFLTELVTHLIESSALESLDAPGVATVVGERGLPAGLREVVLRRVGRLPTGTAELLRLAAVIGPTFDSTVLAAVAGQRADDCDRELEHAVAAGLVTEDPSVFARYRFRHALLRTALADTTGATRRARLHWRIGEAIDSTRRPDDRLALDRAARHLCLGAKAGDAHQAAHVANEAGAAALRELDADAAIELFDASITTLASQPDDALSFDAWSGIANGEILRGSDGWDAALVAAGHALDAAQRLDDRALPARIAMTISRIGSSFARPDAVAALQERALQLVGTEPTSARGVVLAALVHAVWNQLFESGARRVALFTEAMTIGLALPESGDKAFILKHWYMGASSDPALVLEARDACTRSWKASGDLSIEAEARLAQLELRFRFGRAIELTSTEAHAEIDRVEALLQDIPDPALAARLSYLSTSTQLDAGELELADARVRGTEETASDQLAGPLWRSIAVQLIGEIRYQQGRLGELAGLAQQLLDEARTGLEVVAWCSAVAQSQFALGHVDEVHHALDRAIRTARTEDVKGFAGGYVVSWLAEPAAEVGHDTALAWCRQLLSASPGTAVGWGATHGTTDLWLAVIDTALGAPESADTLFASAEQQCLRLELPLWVNLTRCFWASSLIGRDDARSRQLAYAAFDGAEPLGQHLVTTRARALLDQSG